MTDPLHPWSWSPGKSLSLVTFSKPISMHTTRQIPEKIFCKWLWARWHPNPNSSQTIAGKVRLICTNRSFKQRQQKDRAIHTGKCRNPSIQIVRFRMYTSAWLNLFKTGAHFHSTFKRNESFNGLNCAVRFNPGHKNEARKGLNSNWYLVAGGRFELPTFGLWARRATRLLYPAKHT